MLLHYSSIVGAVHCDYLNVTMPSLALAELKADLSGLFDAAGLSSSGDGETYTLADSPGAFKLRHNSRYITLSASGGILRHFRDLGVMNYYLEILGKYPHKITRLDATSDFSVIYAPKVIQDFKTRANAGKLQLTRKALDPKTDITTFMGLNDNGHETGTVYLGNIKSHSVYGKIYDKTFERRQKGILQDSDVIRVELTLKADTGVSLKDVFDPEKVFYHFASRSIVSPPPHFNGWEPFGSGFEIPKQAELFTPAGKIQNIFSNSLDLSRAFKIAKTAYLSEALDVLVAQLRIAFLKREQSSLVAS